MTVAFSSFRFVHTADVHLDRFLKGLTLDSNAPPELLTATRTAFSRLVESAIDEKVAFMIIAGDLYDTDWRDFQTGYFFLAEMGRLRNAGVKVILLYGNHDAEQDMTKKLTLPDNVLCFGSSKPESIVLDEFKVVLHGQSFRRAATTENLASKYPAPVPGYVNIGVLHTALEGRPPHAPYAPCSLDELKNKGYQYWALGHVHQYQILCEDPWIVFPGNLQALHVNEPGAKGAAIVEVEDGVIGRPERVCVDLVRWETVEVNVAGAANLEDVARRVGRSFQSIAGQADGRVVCCRVILTGRTSAHGELYAHGEQLRAEIVGQAVIAAQDRFFIERVGVETQPVLSTEEIAKRGDAVSELQSYFEEATEDSTFLNSLKGDFEALLAKMPPEIWTQEAPALQDVREGRLSALVASVAPGVLDRISPEA